VDSFVHVPLAVKVWMAAGVVTLHTPEVVPPTETEAVVVAPLEPPPMQTSAAGVWRIAMVSPLFTPLTGPAANAPPLIEIPVQPALQVAVLF
jgi:hypothetical protein